MNVVSAPLTRQLYAALKAMEVNDSVRALILTGAGERVFCADSDIAELTQISEPGAALEKKLIFQNKVFEHLRSFAKPTIAALNGYAYGDGLEIAACCDLIVAWDNLTLAQSESPSRHHPKIRRLTEFCEHHDSPVVPRRTASISGLCIRYCRPSPTGNANDFGHLGRIHALAPGILFESASSQLDGRSRTSLAVKTNIHHFKVGAASGIHHTDLGKGGDRDKKHENQ